MIQFVSQLDKVSNSRITFLFKVISIGHSNSIDIKCNLRVENTDECSVGSHSCDSNAVCTDKDDGFSCTCNQGYSGDGTLCTDVDECLANTDDCSLDASCTNTLGSFTCECQTGFTGNGTTCDNIDECQQASTCATDNFCVDTNGSYKCESCETGKFDI